MASLTPFWITGYGKGLQTNKKPFLLPDQAWSTLENEYTWRERVLKREGNQLLGRLQRNFSAINYFLSGASPWSFNILSVQGYVAAANNANPGKITTTYPHGLTTGDKVILTGVLGATGYNNVTFTITVVDALNFTVGVSAAGFGAYTGGGSWISNRSLSATEPLAELVPGSFVLVMGGITFTDNGNGTITGSSVPLTNYGFINYVTGAVVIYTSVAGGTASVLSYSYNPTLPGMGIWGQELSTINEEQTIWWDTKYAYIYVAPSFQEFIPGTQWSGTDSQFFWAYNYQGPAGTRLLFVTNDNNTSDPMYYTDGTTWTKFQPYIISTTSVVYQARIIIPYFSRLILLNTWEGTVAGGESAATNYFARARFSALGDPTASTAFNQDIFGKGGYLDAPTAEAITGCTFVKNTLIVDFEYSTWQLRYVGEYGFPFVWERVSSDFGSGSTFSGVLFDNKRLNVGDVAITEGNAVGVDRIDLDIPDQVFDFQNNQTNNGAFRVWGVRDFQKELVFWNYPDANDESVPGTALTYPNKVLLYNYRNLTWAIFRDNVTAFGTYQMETAANWNSTVITWDDEEITWDDDINQEGFPAIVKLNQQGYAHMFAYQTEDDASLAVTGAAIASTLLELTIPNHNLMAGETIYLTGMMFVNSSTMLPVTTSLNDTIFAVGSVIDADTITLLFWDTSTNPHEYINVGTDSGDYTFTPDLTAATYVGGGQVALFPRPNLISKDINLFQQKGLQTKMSRLDFLMEPQPDNTAVTCNLILNSGASQSANILLTPTNFAITVNPDFVPSQGIDYTWFSFYQTLNAQYFRIQLTYDDDLMNTLTTHQSHLTLYGINAWTRPGGRFASGT
jgi:ubiquitin-activating enzyme E1-like protein